MNTKIPLRFLGICCALISTTLVVKGATWDAVADFASTNTANQVWQYGVTEDDGSGFTLYTRLQVNPVPGLTAWDDPRFEAVVIKNTTGADKRYNGCTLQQADVLNLHPSGNGRKSVVRWKAPAAGTYLVDGRFQDLDVTTTDVSIIQNQNTAQPLFSDLISDGTCNATAVTKPFSLAVTLNAGDTLDFRVGYGNNGYIADSTGLAILIRDDKGAVTNGVLWSAGPNLRANERPDNATEGEATNARVPEWSYGYRSIAASTALTLFTPAQHINDPSGLEGWIAPGQATLAVNTKATPIVFNSGSGNYKPLRREQMYLSPGSSNEFLVARWTAPASGDYRILASWLDLDPHGGNGATAHLVKNGQEQFTQTFQSTTNSTGKANLRARILSLNSGDVLDFVVGSNGEHTFDATAFNAAIRRVPKVTITSPASGSVLTGDVTFNIDVQSSEPIESVAIFFDDQTSGLSDLTSPYSIRSAPKPGYHKVVAEATTADGAKKRSPQIEIIVAPPAAQQSKAMKGPTEADSPAVEPSKLFFSSGSGSWNDPATWGNQGGVPLRWDYAVIKDGHHVTLDLGIEVRDVTVNGRLSGTGNDPRYSLDVWGTFHATGQIENLDLYIQKPFGRFLILGQTPFLRSVNIINYGHLTISSNAFNGEGVTIENLGTIKAGPPPISQEQLRVKLQSLTQPKGLTQPAGKVTIDANGVIEVEERPINLAGLDLSPGYIITQDGASLISENGLGLISDNGAALIGLDGGTLIPGIITQDGASIITQDGASLIGLDGGTLIRPDGTPLIGLDGGTLVGNDGGTIQPALADSGTDPTASTAGDIVLTGGSITGIGEIRGDVVNQGAFIVPGNSAGGIVVNGSYTQEAGGTLVLELGGKTVDPFTYDIFQVAGTANLGGNLVVKTINNYTPASGDTVSALLYASRTGNFTSISSNAQVTLGATGAQVTTNGPNPQGPKALNLSTRLQIQPGDKALFASFIITGPPGSTKKVLIRGLGPSLTKLNVPGAIQDPFLELHTSGATLTNDNWQQAPNVNEIPPGFAPSDPRESLILATLAPGPYSAILTGKNGEIGVGLAEVYDLEENSPAQLANIATRGVVQTDDNVLIGGFIIAGKEPTRVVVRAVGPSLAAFNLQGVLLDPELELHDANGGLIGNDDWRTYQEAEIRRLGFQLSDEREPAVFAVLTPGQYTALVRGKDNTTGIAVVEVYNLQ